MGTTSETTTNWDLLRDRLLTERDRLSRMLGAVTGTLQITEGDDDASAKLRSRLGDVKKALARIEAGTYGRCVTCDGELAAGLLDKSPEAVNCTACEMNRRMSRR